MRQFDRLELTGKEEKEKYTVKSKIEASNGQILRTDGQTYGVLGKGLLVNHVLQCMIPNGEPMPMNMRKERNSLSTVLASRTEISALLYPKAPSTALIFISLSFPVFWSRAMLCHASSGHLIS